MLVPYFHRFKQLNVFLLDLRLTESVNFDFTLRFKVKHCGMSLRASLKYVILFFKNHLFSKISYKVKKKVINS